MAPQPSAELWELRQANDSAKCIALFHPLGLELRYLMNGQPLIARVFNTWDSVVGQSHVWKAGLEARGWHSTSTRSSAFAQSA
jgi:hypothetical protein